MNAPLNTDHIYQAYYQQFLNDPKLINKIVTGQCCWPPDPSIIDYGWDLDDLEQHAREMVKTCEHLVGLFPHYDATWLARMKAARDAIMTIRKRWIEEQTTPDPWSDQPYRGKISRGWQRVL